MVGNGIVEKPAGGGRIAWEGNLVSGGCMCLQAGVFSTPSTAGIGIIPTAFELCVRQASFSCKVLAMVSRTKAQLKRGLP